MRQSVLAVLVMCGILLAAPVEGAVIPLNPGNVGDTFVERGSPRR